MGRNAGRHANTGFWQVFFWKKLADNPKRASIRPHKQPPAREAKKNIVKIGNYV